MNPRANRASFGADNNTDVVGIVHFRRISTLVEDVEDDVTDPSPDHVYSFLD